MKAVRIAQVNAGKWIIEVDGTDVAPAVRGFTIVAERGALAALELELNVFPLEYEGPARVYLARESRDLLVSMGWTPPEA
jgi:hypothetical protein